MRSRASRISKAISKAIVQPREEAKGFAARLLRAVVAFFAVFALLLERYRAEEFSTLRRDVWQLNEEEYLDSFKEDAHLSSSHHDTNCAQHSSTPATASTPLLPSHTHREHHHQQTTPKPSPLVPVGDLGYSGSTFFTTPNAKYLVKSLPRRFEHQYFTEELLDPYAAHMRRRPGSLLVRIVDMVFAPGNASLGGLLGVTPTHHIVMENLLYGKDEMKKTTVTATREETTNEEDRGDEERGEGSVDSNDGSDASGPGWETYDLKPRDYFFPERDIADGMLVPDSVMNKLIDEFPGTVRVTHEAKAQLLELLEVDTNLLAEKSAVDYSLFLVRFPGPNSKQRNPSHHHHHQNPQPSQPQQHQNDDGGGGNVASVPSVPSLSHPWRTGINDINGEWTYRVVVLDFFWAKSTLRAKTMTRLVNAFNLLAKKGPMSITADPVEYRQRFLKMVDAIVVGVC